jgi:hypothetical protein
MLDPTGHVAKNHQPQCLTRQCIKIKLLIGKLLQTLLTSIFTLADATKLPRKIETFKRCLLADCVKSLLPQSANKHPLKSEIFLANL